MQSGELIATGILEVQIALNGLPIKVNVVFDDQGEIFAPCSPQAHDSLMWSVSGNILTINMNVNGFRLVTWNAWFYWNDVPQT
jgi:hypothetical protein